jgi:hypothetical protein
MGRAHRLRLFGKGGRKQRAAHYADRKELANRSHDQATVKRQMSRLDQLESESQM